jgi:hypothetical protein
MSQRPLQSLEDQFSDMPEPRVEGRCEHRLVEIIIVASDRLKETLIMGATGWTYFTPYQENLETALQQLRQQVFEEGKYKGTVAELYEHWDYMAGTGTLSEKVQKDFEMELARLESMPPSTTIEEAIAVIGFGGTYSILDIRNISLAPTYGAAL